MPGEGWPFAGGGVPYPSFWTNLPFPYSLKTSGQHSCALSPWPTNSSPPASGQGLPVWGRRQWGAVRRLHWLCFLGEAEKVPCPWTPQGSATLRWYQRGRTTSL